VSQSGGGQYNKKRGWEDRIQGNWAMAVVNVGDAAGDKGNNQIETTLAVVRTVGAAIDCGEARAKGKMIGWRTMQGDQVVEDATGDGPDNGR
jgi:hypothetical protein